MKTTETTNLEPVTRMKEHLDKITKLTSALQQANELLRSAYSIAEREGKNTHWKLFEHQLMDALFAQRDLLFTPETNATNPVYGRAASINPAGKIDVLVMNSVQKEQWKELARFAWTIVSNTSGGNWDSQSQDWREAADELRIRVHDAMVGISDHPVTTGDIPPGKYKDTIDWLQSDVSGVIRMHDGWTVWDVRFPTIIVRNKDLIEAVKEIVSVTEKELQHANKHQTT